MRKPIILFILPFIVSVVQCAGMPDIFKQNTSAIVDFVDKTASTYFSQDDTGLLPVSKNMAHIDKSSEIYRRGGFLAGMAKSSNCRPSLDKWDCLSCYSTLPDGIVARSFDKMGTKGAIVVSAKNRTIYITITGLDILANPVSYQSRLNSTHLLVPHPFIPGAKVNEELLRRFLDIREFVWSTMRDQIQLHSNYAIEVLGHSIGGGIASLIGVDLFQRLSMWQRNQVSIYTLGRPRVGDKNYVQYIIDNNINVKRYVNGDDVIPHYNLMKDGYEHEGDEYWLISKDEFVVCPGPRETKSCSQSVDVRTFKSHLTYFDTFVGCNDEDFVKALLSFTEFF